MKEEQYHIDELIGKYLAGECSSDEKAFVESWRSMNAENRRYFDHFRLIFDRSLRLQEQQVFDAEAAWRKVKNQVGLPAGKIRAMPVKTSGAGWGFFLRVAATVLLIALAGYAGWQLTQPTETFTPVEFTSGMRIEEEKLPDGSNVVLHKQTRIRYGFDKKLQANVAKLEGEAYFNVHAQAGEKFIVESDGVFIEDIGTAFNVKAYPDSATIEVVVEEGEVMFYTETDSGLYLKAGGKGIYDKRSKTFSVSNPEPNVTAYKTKFFNFNNTDLKTVVNTLNQVYDTTIVIDENLHSCRLTVSFNQEKMGEIVAVIAETLNLSLEESASAFVLKGEGCQPE